MRTVYKYPLTVQHEPQSIEMPDGAEVLYVGVDASNGQPALWCAVDPERQPVTRKFAVSGTGHPVPDSASISIGMTQIGLFVWHWWECDVAASDGWIEWCGGKCPLADDTKHEVRFRDGSTAIDPWPQTWIWSHKGDNDDIIAYRVVPS